ncbi:MAG: hypothetical protein KatS3mg063_0498 [Tepidiforma sp.]|jgi:hypothetical protein|uniref:N-acetyltransferase domain-containing protein n=1 Tax=Tepidiforma bonchosmolovskayae TaxID=2601677 RepID=A0ABX6C3M5_9CHLR|nr:MULTISPECIES: hypothetical protein [Tepidiforma]QFG03021.1 hypothetical protein Tbon_06840 [Tepidiforma bonchosmolovskayae]GIW14645.1 MAG: hypothetical protein KatS3mg063_0498 [Tepidiforma sp.]
MSELAAEALSPIDAATLWPQLHRLDTEVVALRGSQNLLVSSGLAATGITRLPRVPRTAVVGLRRGLSYRGVAVARQLAGGAGWDVASVRIGRPKDDDAVAALLQGLAREVALRGGRVLYLRYAEGSPHAAALRRAGFFAYRLERLYAIRSARAKMAEGNPFRPAARADRAGIFRLYCRAVPEQVRRNEAPGLQEFRAVLDSFDCEHEFVADGDGALIGWAGIGEREAHLLLAEGGSLVEAALDTVEAHAPRHGALVVAEHQPGIEAAAQERGYPALGVRLMCARRLARAETLKEVVAVPAESFPVPQ